MPGILITLDLDNHDHLDNNYQQEHFDHYHCADQLQRPPSSWLIEMMVIKMITIIIIIRIILIIIIVLINCRDLLLPDWLRSACTELLASDAHLAPDRHPHQYHHNHHHNRHYRNHHQLHDCEQLSGSLSDIITMMMRQLGSVHTPWNLCNFFQFLIENARDWCGIFTACWSKFDVLALLLLTKGWAIPGFSIWMDI